MFLLNMLALAVLSVACMTYFSIRDLYQAFHEEAASLREEHYAARKAGIRSKVNLALSIVQHERRLQIHEQRKALADFVRNARTVAATVEVQARERPRDAREKLVLATLAELRLHETNMCTITNADGTVLLAQDTSATGNDLAKRFAFAAEKGEGFFDHKCQSRGGEPEDVICYVARFQPYDWVICAAIPKSELETRAQESVLDKLRFMQRNKAEYVFIGRWDGMSLLGPAEGKNMWDATDSNGLKVVQELIRVAREGGGFVNYEMPAGEEQNRDKISYAVAVPDWEWYLGSGTFTDAIEQVIARRRAELNGRVRHKLAVTAIVLICLIVLIGVFVHIGSQRLDRALAQFTSFFRSAAVQSTRIDQNKVPFAEFTDLAVHANKMVEEREEASIALRASEERFRTIMEESPLAIQIYDLDGTLLQVNRAWQELYQAEPEDAIGKFNCLQDPQLKNSPFAELLRRALQDERVGGEENEFAPAKSGYPGRKRHLRSYIYPLFGDDKELRNVVVMQLDVTKEREVELALRQNEENLRLTLHSIADAVIATDVTGRITRMNPVAEALTGWPAATAKGKPLCDVFQTSSAGTGKKLPCPADHVLATGQVQEPDSEILLLDRGGESRFIDESVAPMHNLNGEIIGVVLVFRDISDRRRIEEQLRQAQKMDSVGQLAGGVAHDFNNMLGGILGFAELLSNRLEEQTKPHWYAQMILDTASNAADLTTKLLAFSRKANAVRKPVDLHSVAESAVALLSHSIDRRITIEKQFDAEFCRVNGDRSLLQNAIINMGVNARDAMPEGGVLRIETVNRHVDEIEASTDPFDMKPGLHIEIAVSDTGKGMSHDIVNRIFEPFFTTKEVGKGTGLGLAAVYGTIKEHHGSIRVYSQPEKGTEFRILLPLLETGRIRKRGNTTAELPKHATILLADDEEIMRTLGAEILDDIDYDIILAANGEEAVERYREHADSIDVVILDMVMPRLNGNQVFHAIREMNPDARIIIASGYTREAGIQDLMRQGLRGFVQKPFGRDSLLRALAKALSH